jgi:hypothetical protein
LQASASSRGDEIAAGRKKLATESEKHRLEIASLQDEIAELNSKLEALDASGGTGKVCGAFTRTAINAIGVCISFLTWLQAAAKGKKGKGVGSEAAGEAISLASSDRAEYNKLKATGTESYVVHNIMLFFSIFKSHPPF